MQIWRTTTNTFKIIKKKVKNVAHVSFLKICIKSGIVPKSLRINKNRYHSDLLKEINHLNIALKKSELSRQKCEGKRIKKAFDENHDD